MEMTINSVVETAKTDTEKDAQVQEHEQLDDDGKPRRTGTLWTASAHIITAVIGSGVLALAWAMSQLGWIAGSMALALFSLVTFYNSRLLSDCYRTGDPVYGHRNHSYLSAVKCNLGGGYYVMCGFCQYVNLFGASIGYTITAGLSLGAILRANCFHFEGHDADCRSSTTVFIVGFGIIQILLSQLSNFHKLWWLSIVAAVMSFCYSFIAVGLSAASVISGHTGKTTLTGTVVGVDVDQTQKIWRSLQALGNIAFAYSFSLILIEIQDTLKSSPAENKVMKRASFIAVSITTVFYALCGCLGYAAFGNQAPGNILTGFGFYEPFWLIDIGNLAIVVHLVGAYQVFCQPLYYAVETWIASICPNSKIMTREHPVVINKWLGWNVNIFRLVWRTAYVVLCTVLAVVLPFFNDVLAFLGALGFWPLTVFFPIEMYIAQKGISRFTTKWLMLRSLSCLCFLISLAAAVASIQGIRQSLRHYSPFQNSQ